MAQTPNTVNNGLVSPALDPNKGLMYQTGALGTQFKAQGQLGTAQALASQSQSQAQRVQGLLNARVAQGNLAHPLSQVLGSQPAATSSAPAQSLTTQGAPAISSTQSTLSAPPIGYIRGADGSITNGAGQAYSAPNSGGSSNPGVVPSPITNPISTAVSTPSTPSSSPNNSSITPTTAGLVPAVIAAGSSNPDVEKAKADLQALKDQQASELFQVGATPGLGLSEASGQEGLINQLYATKINAAQSALSTAQGQQSTQVGATESALGAVAPITGVPYGTQTIQPGLIGTNSNSGGGEVSPSDPFYATLQTYAQSLANNQGSAIPSSISGNPVLQAQLLKMAKAINPSFNYNTAQGVGSAETSNAATGGTASVTANQGVYNTAMGNLANYQNMAANIKSFGDQAIQNIKSLPLSSSQLANTTIQQAMTQFNSPEFAQFNANIQGLQARVSALLGTGEIPSSATAGAQAIINGTINLAALNSTMNQINNEASAIVGNQAGIASKAYQNIKNGQATLSGSSSGGSTQFNSDGTLKAVSF